jgi:hypothetical protein
MENELYFEIPKNVYRVSRLERPKLHECMYLHVKIMLKKTHRFLSDFLLFSGYSLITNKQNRKH